MLNDDDDGDEEEILPGAQHADIHCDDDEGDCPSSIRDAFLSYRDM